MSIIPIKHTIIIHNFNFDKKLLVQFKKFKEKRTKLHHLSKVDQIETKKKLGGPT